MADRAMVTVDAAALRQVLMALTGPAHLIREIQMTRSVAALTGDDPIGLLVTDYNADVQRQADAAAGVTLPPKGQWRCAAAEDGEPRCATPCGNPPGGLTWVGCVKSNVTVGVTPSNGGEHG